MLLRPTIPPSFYLLAASLLLTTGCRRDEVTHFRVAKPAAAPAPAMPAAAGGPMMGGAPPGMAGDVAPPPAPDGGLTWTLPKGWSEKKAGGMRYATFTPNVAGKIDGSVVVLPGPAGGELQNVNRWRNQIGLAPIDEGGLASARTVVKTKAGALSVYDFTSDGQVKSRVIAGLLEARGSTWFVKLSGDATAVATARADFLRLMESLRLE
ncbi:MAG TPA: hypothetical protein VFP50_08935 [Anaeromyxobacteraceae bacterium]|nr:hypothetical protein [Anaeromyxobacteraceae bacterium]